MHASAATQPPDPTGRVFISYRRSRADEVGRLVRRLGLVGVPTWLDTNDLGLEPIVQGLEEQLRDPGTSGAVLWATRDIAGSPFINSVEVPEIVKRLRENDGFYFVPCVAGDLPVSGLSAVLTAPGLLSGQGSMQNVHEVENDPATDADLRRLTQRVLKQRLKAVLARIGPEDPISVDVYAHARAPGAPRTGAALTLDWTPYFKHRHAHGGPTTWLDVLLPALRDVVDALCSGGDDRPVVVSGFASISTAFAIGRATVTPGFGEIGWKEKSGGQIWSLAAPPVDVPLDVRTERTAPTATNLAVLVSIRNDVEPAVSATQTKGGMPAFSDVVHIVPTDGRATVHIGSAGEAHRCARMIEVAIRAVRAERRTIGMTHIFFAGPVGLAMLIGRLLNAVGPVQIYEHVQPQGDAVGYYEPGALLTD